MKQIATKQSNHKPHSRYVVSPGPGHKFVGDGGVFDRAQPKQPKPSVWTPEDESRSRVELQCGRIIDASALTVGALSVLRAAAMAREPMLWAEASSDTPNDPYARTDRFLMLFEAERKEPFRL